jgi:sigma-B regulation protein RsbU (phosphoserine phosphatase)
MVKSKNNFTILIVDDNLVNVKLLEKALTKNGYYTISTTEATQAISLATVERPDLILLDIMMPGENGFSIGRQLQLSPETSSIPIIFITSRNDLDAKMMGFELGAVDYITKPFYIQEVLARVRLHLRLSLATNSLVKRQAEKLQQIQNAQSSLLVLPENFPDARFSVYYLSLLEAGGDFYDVLKISDDIFGYFLGDISGHDIATSYMTAAVKALLTQNCIPIYKPQESIRLINNVLMEILPDEKYMTACYGLLNRKTKSMTIVNAGHPPPVYIPNGGKPQFIEITGDVLGFFPNVSFGAQNISVSEGDRFFLYSDGLIERIGAKKVWAKQKRKLLDLCGNVNHTKIQKCAETIANRMIGNGSHPEDDVVVLGIEV